VQGVTILQSGTTNGISSDVDGNFTISVPGAPDSVTLVVSFVGYVTQRLRVAAGSNTSFRLAQDTHIIDCPVLLYPKVEVGLLSGIRYAPFGGTLKLVGNRLLRLPLSARASYQTNFDHSHFLSATLELPPVGRWRLPLSETLTYQQLQAMPAGIHFVSYTATVGVDIDYIARLRMPALLIGAGYARYCSPLAEQSATGDGFSFGLRQNFLPYPYQLFGSVLATRWPGYWQWQGQLTHPFGRSCQAGITINRLRSYSEASVLLSRAFY